MIVYWAPFGERLRTLRQDRGLTQQLLADQAGLSRSYIARLETEDQENPTLRVLLRLLYVLDVPLCEFFAPFTEVISP